MNDQDNKDRETSPETTAAAVNNEDKAKAEGGVKLRDCGCLFLNWWDRLVAGLSRLFHRGRS